MCDPIWQVTLRSCEMVFHEQLGYTVTFTYLTFAFTLCVLIVSIQLRNVAYRTCDVTTCRRVCQEFKSRGMMRSPTSWWVCVVLRTTRLANDATDTASKSIIKLRSSSSPPLYPPISSHENRFSACGNKLRATDSHPEN